MNEEDRGAHDKFCQELIDRFQADDPLELQFASLIAEDFWRLQRIRAVENDILALGNFSEAADIDVDHPEIHASLTRARTFLDQSKDFERLTLYEQRINRSIEKNRRQLEDLQAERKRQRQEALEQVCLLRQAPVAQEHPIADENAQEYSDGTTPEHGINPAASIAHNGFVFSTEEIERAIDRRSRLIQARIMQNRADGLIKAALIKVRAANREAGCAWNQ